MLQDEIFKLYNPIRRKGAFRDLKIGFTGNVN